MLILRQNDQSPSDPEWDGFLTLLKAARPEFDRLKILILTDGGGPNAAQRKRLADTLGGKAVRVAVISDSIKVRFVASTIALFHKEHRSFLKSEFRNACGHLGMSSHEGELAKQTLEDLAPLVEPEPQTHSSGRAG